MKRARNQRRPLGLPEIDGGEYLIAAMQKLDPVRSNGMELRATDWPEILAFAHATGRISEPWEFETLFDMCVGYFEAREAGADPLAIAPVDQDPAG